MYYNCILDEGDESSTKASAVETVCVVDIRDNTPESTSFPYELDKVWPLSAVACCLLVRFVM